MAVKIGYIVGSLSSTSINRAVFEAVKKNAPQNVEIVEIPISELPHYAPDYDADFPQVARDFKAAIEESDAVIVATPQYNDSFSGVVKNAIDWASRPWGQHSFNAKPTAIATASIAPHGGAKAGALLGAVLEFGQAKLVESQLNVFVGEETFAADGNFASAELQEELAHSLRLLQETQPSNLPHFSYTQTAWQHSCECCHAVCVRA
ncbi:NADPH-dependent FMN reductase [Timonella sp. A28]|uniref:NADPH-dependent FMN reductase n=1 Tax=Timonella sp. A28 TaxID=3442640 RepID=UPI003EB70073